MKHNCIASALAAFLLFSSLAFAGERVAVWPKGKMPHRQQHQIAAMTDEAPRRDSRQTSIVRPTLNGTMLRRRMCATEPV